MFQYFKKLTELINSELIMRIILWKAASKACGKKKYLPTFFLLGDFSSFVSLQCLYGMNVIIG